MRLCRLIFIGAVVAFLLLPIYQAYSQDYVDYKIQVNVDNSAIWSITRVSDINASIDLEGFQPKVEALINAAVNATHREMSLDVNSLQVSDEISWETQSRKTVYVFRWQNFSLSENGKIILGDVFQVTDSFSQLYGDGTLEITYPSGYSIQSITPIPDYSDISSLTAKWFRTQGFINGKPSIVLINNPQTLGDSVWQQYLIIGLISAATAAIVSFYLIRRRRSKTKLKTEAAMATALAVESDEEKISRLLRSSGGNLRQSVITEQCGFSKAKTSQLLAALERKGIITRYKKGRDKIVTLNERATGEKP